MRTAMIACLLALSPLDAAVQDRPDIAKDAPSSASGCRLADLDLGSAPIMAVRLPSGDRRLHLLDKALPCPPSGACPHRQKAYLVPGDLVLTANEAAGHRCVVYGTAKGRFIAGFLPADRLTPHKEERRLSPDFLHGSWENAYASLEFSRGEGASVRLTGSATWEGETTANEGEIEADAEVRGQAAVFQDEDCALEVRRRGPYLLAHEDGVCGGLNVTFSGVYSRTTRKTDPAPTTTAP